MANIKRKGLLIPGQGEGYALPPAHGFNFNLYSIKFLGVPRAGIYLGKTPADAQRFATGNGPNLFVCLAIVGSHIVTTANGTVLIVNNVHKV